MAGTAPAQSQEFGILTNQPSAGWYSFGFDGRFVVWSDNRAGGGGDRNDIYAHDLLTRTEIPVATDPVGHKSQCRVSDGMVAWMRQPAPLTVQSNQLWVKDLTGRIWAAGETRMIAVGDCMNGPDISGDWVAWTQDGCGGNGGNLYAHNLHTSERITIPQPGTNWHVWHVVVSGNNVFFPTTPGYVWGPGQDWDVYGFNLVSRTLFPVKVGPGNFDVLSADGDYALLEEVPAYSTPPPRKLWLHNLVSSNAVLIVEASDPRGSVSGNTVVYADDSGQLFAYEISIGSRYLVSSGPARGYPPLEVRNDLVVWTDQRAPASEGNWFIYGRRLQPGSFADDFEDGVINTNLWLVGGARAGVGGVGSGDWQWSVTETGGASQLRVWGPTSGNTYGAEAWVRSKYNFNDGNSHVINFRWGASVNAYHIDAYAIQMSDGAVDVGLDTDLLWFTHDTAGTKNLYLSFDPANPPPGDVGQTNLPPTQWSVQIDAAKRTAKLFSGPNLGGVLIGQKSLGASLPWYVRFIMADMTSAGFPEGDNSLLLYDFAATHVELPPEATIRVSQVDVCWASLTNRVYQVQYRSTVTTNAWTDLGAQIAGTGAMNCISDPVASGQPSRFYRVVMLP